MRISDWSSDVCSSDLKHQWPAGGKQAGAVFRGRVQVRYAVHRSEVGIDAVEGAVEVGELVDAQVSCGHRGGRGRASDACLGAGDHPGRPVRGDDRVTTRSEEHTSELQSLMRISYAVFCLKKKKHSH